MLAILFSFVTVYAQQQTPQEILNEKIVTAFQYLRRINSPQSQPPVAFLVRETSYKSNDEVTNGLNEEAAAIPETLFKFKLNDLTSADLKVLFDEHSPFMNFVRDITLGPRYAVITGETTTVLRKALLDKIIRTTAERQLTPNSGAAEPLRNTAFLMEVVGTDEVADGLTVNALAQHADYSVDLNGYRLDIFQGFRLPLKIESCADAIKNPVQKSLASLYPNLGPPLRPRRR